MRHPLLLPIKKKFGRKYVKTTMRMLTILREAEEWTHGHLREVCLLSAITKSSLFVRQNDKAHAHQVTLLSLLPYRLTVEIKFPVVAGMRNCFGNYLQ